MIQLLYPRPPLPFRLQYHPKPQLQLFASTDMLEEWQRVLHYPQIQQAHANARGTHSEAPQQAPDLLLQDSTYSPEHEIARQFAQLVRPCTRVEVEAADWAHLPRCRDQDDQKFLSCAVQVGAHLLLTRDKKLLKIGRHRQFKALGLSVRSTMPADFSNFNSIEPRASDGAQARPGF